MKGKVTGLRLLSQTRSYLDEQSNLRLTIAPAHAQNYAAFEPFFETIYALTAADDLVNLLKAILLERTIVFVGPEWLLSQFVLGLVQLIAPFKWVFSIIPVLPMALLDMLDAPMPLIVGITEEEYAIWRENADQESISRTIWVHLKIEQAVDGGYRPVVVENLSSNLDYNSPPRGNEVLHHISDVNECQFGGLIKSLKQQKRFGTRAMTESI